MSVVPGFARLVGTTAPVALQPQVGVQSARMYVAGGRDQDPVLVDGPDVLRGAAEVRVGRVVGIGVVAVLSAALGDVEYRVSLTVLDVHPDWHHRHDALRGRGRRRDEIDVVRDPHLRPVRGEVVDHVVEQPVVGGLVRVAVAGRELQVRLLFPDCEEPLWKTGRRRVRGRQIEPHRVVEVDDVDARCLAVRVHEVGANTDDPTVDGRLLHRRTAVLDVVLARLDRKRTDLEVQPFRAAIRRLAHRCQRRDVLRVGRNGRSLGRRRARRRVRRTAAGAGDEQQRERRDRRGEAVCACPQASCAGPVSQARAVCGLRAAPDSPRPRHNRSARRVHAGDLGPNV